MQTLGPADISRKNGNEELHAGGVPLGTTLLEFWRWAFSDILNNTTRGVLAEFLIASAMGISHEGVREPWAAFDLITSDGIKIEVKSAAYIQSWQQSQFSTISFRVPPRRYWDKESNLQSQDARRSADVYVFALLAHIDQNTLDPLDVSQWQFYVLPTFELDNRQRSQHSITLRSLATLAGDPVGYSDLHSAIKSAWNRQRIA